ncbi:MAG: class I SAM-dependent methyltransferase [Bacteroidia bacterium]
MNNLTNKDFWNNYWSTYKYVDIPTKFPFDSFLPLLINRKNFIEIGGFPGTISGYFYKKVCKDVTLIDFHINKEIINNLEKLNNLPLNSIKCIECDFFSFETVKKYDIVFSYGFIEHFENTEDVIRRHINLLSKNGSLLIVLPNFRGINGWVQFLLDKENYLVHNLNSMKFNVLENVLKNNNIHNIKIEYSKKPMIWLSPNVGTKSSHFIVKQFSYLLKLFPIKCRILSPFIIVYGEKLK